MRLGLGKRGAVFSLWTLQAIFCVIGLAILPHRSLAGLLAILFFLMVTSGTIFFFRKKRSLILHWNGRSGRRKKKFSSVSA